MLRTRPIRLPATLSYLPFEHHGLAVVQEHPVPEHVGDGAGEDAALDVAPLAHQILGRVAVADALDILFDDRALVEIGGDEVRRRSDQLNAPRVRLMIRPRPFEPGQERMRMLTHRPWSLAVKPSDKICM